MRAAIAAARAAGIRVVMMTGDHPATARAIVAPSGSSPADLSLAQDFPASAFDMFGVRG